MLKQITKFFVVTCLLASCQSYNRYNVAGYNFSVGANTSRNAISAIKELGLRIDIINTSIISTKWETFYNRDNEYNSRIVINLNESIIKGQCLQRRTKAFVWEREGAPWAFYKCKGAAAERVERNVYTIVMSIFEN